jgi:hypothetical protein
MPTPGRSLKFLYTFSLTLLSSTAYVFESGAQANEIPLPKLVPPCQCGVGDVFAITDDSDEAPVGGVDQRGRKDFGGPNFFSGDGDAAAVCEGGRGVGDGLEISGDDVLVPGVDEFSGRVHAEC